MLSVLIPVYNYNAFPLVLELQKQCIACKIEFEVIAIDDCSDKLESNNLIIDSLAYCFFHKLNKNIGRSAIRNLLAQKAKYNWLLLLDCDMFPIDSNYIKKYVDAIKRGDSSIYFGGIIYEAEKPDQSKILRWIYGAKREALSVEDRIKNPNSSALTSNLLIRKQLLLENAFDEKLIQYGYEDLYFLINLESKNQIVRHIENQTFHLNLETSIVFLNKTKLALQNLNFILIHDSSIRKFSKIIRTYLILQKFKLVRFAAFIFNQFESKITSNLLSANPSMLLFDLYKLGYFCKINSLS